MRYAVRTSVPVSHTKANIEALVTKYGATSFVSGWNERGEATVAFRMQGRSIRFIMPKLELARRNTEKAQLQLERTAWRALLLLIKAKLEAVASGFTVFDEEWLAHLVTDTGETIFERLRSQLPEGNVPLALPARF